MVDYVIFSDQFRDWDQLVNGNKCRTRNWANEVIMSNTKLWPSRIVWHQQIHLTGCLFQVNYRNDNKKVCHVNMVDNSSYEGCSWMWKYWHTDSSRSGSVEIQIVQACNNTDMKRWKTVWLELAFIGIVIQDKPIRKIYSEN